MAVKAIVRIKKITAVLNSEFTVDAEVAFLDAASQATFDVNGLGPFAGTILGLSLNNAIASAAKAAAGISGLDTVRLLGTDLIAGL
jgi:hypothetical protein